MKIKTLRGTTNRLNNKCKYCNLKRHNTRTIIRCRRNKKGEIIMESISIMSFGFPSPASFIGDNEKNEATRRKRDKEAIKAETKRKAMMLRRQM